jgi:AsmA protein
MVSAIRDAVQRTESPWEYRSMKIFKYALFALGGLVVLIGVILGVVAATFDPNQYKPQIVQAVKDKTQRTLKLDGNIRLAFWPGIGGRVGKASLSERASEQEFAAVEDVHVSVKLLPLLSKQAVVDTVRIKGLRANIVKSKDGKLNVDDLAGAPPAKEAPAAKGGSPDPGLQVDVAGIEVSDSTVTYTDQAEGSKYTLSKVDLKTGRIAPGVPARIELKFHTQGDQPKLDLQTALKTRLKFDPGRSAALDDIELDSSGTAAGMTNLVIKIKGNAAVDLAKERAQVKLEGKLADSNVKAQVEMTGFEKPEIRFDAEADQIDLDRYLPQQTAGKPAPAQKPAGKEEPFDLSGLRNLRAAGVLKVGSLKANNIRASNVRLDIKANGGRVDVNPLVADFYQGKLKSAIAINAAPATPTFAVKHNMSGITIGPLLKDLADADILEGKGDITLDVTTQGNTVTALKKALDGNAGLKLADGAVKGIDIAGSIRDAKARLGALRGEHDQAADQTKKTDFSELTATFKVAKGVARNNDLSLKSPLLRVGGEGEVNIGEDRLNYLVKASIVGTSQGQGGREAEELRGVTVPVRIAGPLEKPSYKLDFGKAATESARQRLGDEVQKRLGGGDTKDSAAEEGTKSGGSTRDRVRDLLKR